MLNMSVFLLILHLYSGSKQSRASSINGAALVVLPSSACAAVVQSHLILVAGRLCDLVTSAVYILLKTKYNLQKLHMIQFMFLSGDMQPGSMCDTRT